MMHKIPNGQHSVFTPTLGEVAFSIRTDPASQVRFVDMVVGGQTILFRIDAAGRIQNRSTCHLKHLQDCLVAIAMLSDRFNTA